MYKIFGDSGFDISFIAILSIFTAFWVISAIIKNVSIVDILWGFAYAVQVFCFYFTHSYNWANLLLTILVALHGLRLFLYIFIRNCGHEEDKRYQAMRAKFGGEKHYWWVSFFQVFMFQAIISMGVGSIWGLAMLKSAKDIISNEVDVTLVTPNIIVVIVGAVVTFSGTLLETIADWQLYSHINDPDKRGKLLSSGAWSLCRHPNYFGETVFWWGTYFFNCAVTQYWAIYSPVVMTLLIVFVSGVSLLEDGMRKTEKYGEEYTIYVAKTAKFIPFIW